MRCSQRETLDAEQVRRIVAGLPLDEPTPAAAGHAAGRAVGAEGRRNVRPRRSFRRFRRDRSPRNKFEGRSRSSNVSSK